MSSGELLHIQPQELLFPFELKKQISCSLRLSNKTDNYVAFKVQTTNPKKYCVRPNAGVVMPRSTCDVIVTMQAQKKAPADMQCKDKFLLQSVVARPGATAKDITPEMFNKKSGHDVKECKLGVLYVAPPQPPSPVREGADEDSSPRASVSENGHSSALEFTVASKAFNEHGEHQDTSYEASTLISKLTEERNSVIEQNKRLRQELASKAFNEHGEHQDTSYEAWSLISKLTEERNSVIEQNKRLQQELARSLISKLTEERNSVIEQNKRLQQELASKAFSEHGEHQDTSYEFNKESGHDVEKCKLRVLYVAPQPPSPVREGADEDSSPRASVSENGHSSALEFTVASKAFNEHGEHQDTSYEARSLISKLTEERNSVIEQNKRLQQELASKAFNEHGEHQDTSDEARSLISKVTEERNSVIEQNKRLQQELELLRRDAGRSGGGVPLMYVVLVGIIGIILGFLFKRT